MYVDDVMDLIEELAEAHSKATWHRLSLLTTENPVERRFLTAMADYWDGQVMRLRHHVRQTLLAGQGSVKGFQGGSAPGPSASGRSRRFPLDVPEQVPPVSEGRPGSSSPGESLHDQGCGSKQDHL
jgi:hypothetical protein